jgi:hypothetical protein
VQLSEVLVALGVIEEMVTKLVHEAGVALGTVQRDAPPTPLSLAYLYFSLPYRRSKLNGSTALKVFIGARFYRVIPFATTFLPRSEIA